MILAALLGMWAIKKGAGKGQGEVIEVDQKAAAEADALRKHGPLLAFNLILTVIVIAILSAGLATSYVVFMVALCILLAVNYPDQKLQDKLIKKHAPAALIRRSQVYSRDKANELRVGPFRMDLLKMECYKDGELLMFTGRELGLFRFLLENPGQVFSKEQLYRQIWNDAVVDDNTITVYIKRIRAKIETDPKQPVYLKTVRGIGYRMDA